MLAGRKILLIITGGIAAFKAIDLMRMIKKAGGDVQPILTKSALEFVTPLTAGTVAGNPALSELFDLGREAEINHIELVRDADLIVVVPATGDFMAKMAHGFADDLASTAILARDKHVIVAPSMNVRMWEAAPTQRNFQTLVDDGMSFVGPDKGEMACGEFGLGRLAEPDVIFAAIKDYFFTFGENLPLKGKRVLVTSGATREPLDPVRFLTNASSGKQGTAIASALRAAGADVEFITGAADVPPPDGVNVTQITTAQDMYDAVHEALPCDVAIFCAAVSDWRPKAVGDKKIKKNGDGTAPSLEMVLNPDILHSVAQLEPDQRPQLVIGFAAETNDVVKHAEAKLVRKGCDWLLANDVSAGSGTFGGDHNSIIFFDGQGHQEWAQMSKAEVGQKLTNQITSYLKQPD
ncbi:bifunctional phosphopantothenoylcysteine decarboxylase/phosphopantothenate--cysteine ligase CoaBC [Maritalea sp.]|uniref:bifunctional phosphopantothenoylcysteine decarboxylase/phosphopantothenate--cysteine ligase CoaBC n=1 Tax=Maritalea sp. TaxID=2003361 RepID=UPI003EF45784